MGGRSVVYENLSRSAGGKKVFTAAAVADFGDAQALWIPPLLPFPLGIESMAVTLVNRSGGAAKVGLCGRIPSSLWAAGQVTAAGVYTDDTTDAQDVGADDFPLHDRADSGSGFLVSCSVPFNLIAVLYTVAGDQTTPVLIVEFWNGTAWTAITTSLLIDDALNGGVAPLELVLCWPQPSDWVVGGSGTGVPSTAFNIRVRQTHGGAGTVNPAAAQLIVGFAKMQMEAVADNASVALIREHPYRFPKQCDALFPVFSTAHRGNIVEADVRGW